MNDEREFEHEDRDLPLTDDLDSSPETAAKLGGAGGVVVGAIAGAALGPLGAVAGAVVGGTIGAVASGAAVNAMNDDGTPADHRDGVVAPYTPEPTLPGAIHSVDSNGRMPFGEYAVDPTIYDEKDADDPTKIHDTVHITDPEPPVTEPLEPRIPSGQTDVRNPNDPPDSNSGRQVH